MLVHDRYRPTLMLIYLPHLDYGLQKLGPVHPKIPDEVRTIDRVVGRLIDYFDSKGVRIVLLSEYGIETVDDSVHINRSLREAGAVAVREEQGLELLDPGASEELTI
ncbi:MAG: alkaline phosphatase family protein [Gemmatimonadetes bacterium]|nr:alkaline phosphatase family protein [Gemmatimonadota bacterium]